MPKFKVKYRANPGRPSSVTSKEVVADRFNTSDDWITFVDDDGQVWQVGSAQVIEIERVDDE